MIPYDTTMAENTSTNKAYYLNSSSISLEVGKQSTISVYPYPGTPEIGDDDEVLWESDNSTGVSVENKGSNTATIKALVANLTATISVTVNGIAVADTCNVSVFGVSIDSIAISNTTLSLNEGASGALSAKVGPENASVKGVKWSSSNENVATVDQSGNVHALSAGVATISAETKGTNSQGQHLTASCSVAVEVVTKDSVVAFADNYAKQFDENADSKYCVTLNTFLYVDKKYTIPLLQGRKVDKADETSIPIPALLLTSISYHKEVYKPGFLELVIETEASMSAFSGTVTLEYDKQVVASTYYIFEKRKKNKYVTLRAYSVDKFLTIDKFSQAFTGKKLIEDIVNATLNNYKKSESKIEVFCDNVTHVENEYSDIANLRHLKYVSTTASTTHYLYNGELITSEEESELSEKERSKVKDYYPTVEPSLPYNVQFEESFYDFLVRVCNRNGEFLYVEDNKLHVGIPKAGTAVTITGDGAYEIEETEAEEMYDASTVSGNTLFPAEYYKPIRKLDDDFAKNEDYYIGGAIGLNLLKPVVESQNILDSAPQTAMALAATFGISESFKKKANEGFIKNFGDYRKGDIYQFVNSESSTFGNSFYTNILNYEKQAEQHKLIVTSSTYKSHKLGDTVIFNGNNYVVCQITGGAKIIDGPISLGSENIQRYREEFEMVLLPYIAKSDSAVTYPYPMPLLDKRVRKATAQRATVSANNDPMRLGRVRVLFDWQDSEDSGNASPWINVAYPMASKDSGFMFLPGVGDTVLVDFVDGNVEHPYVVGSFYREDRLPSFHATTQNAGLVKSITSSNGHHLTFTDLSGARFGANLLPWTYLSKFGIMDQLGFMPDDNRLGGGFELADYYGFYSITGSTHERKVSIKSPFGDVSIDAFQGITISAPSGNIKIEGKNVDIIARNNLSITSGTNIAQPRWGSRDAMDYEKSDPSGTKIRKVAKYLGIDHMLAPWIVGVVRGILDLSLYRTWLEVLLRPVGGSLLIKSHRFMKLEAGKGRTAIHTSFAKRGRNAVKWLISSSFVGKASKDQTMADIVAYKADIIRDCKLINGIYCADGKLDKLFQEIQRCAFSTLPVQQVLQVDLQAQIKNVSSGNSHPYFRTANDIYKEIVGDLRAIKQEWTQAEVNERIAGINDWINNLKVDINGGLVTIFVKPTENPLNQLHVRKKLYEYIHNKQNEIKDLVTIAETVPNQNRNYNAETLKDKITIKHPDMNHMRVKKTIGILAKATGLSGALDDHTWSKNDEGGILISAHKDAMYKITKEGQLKGYVPEIDAAWQNFLIQQLRSVPDDGQLGVVRGVVRNQQPNQGQDAAAPPPPQAPAAPQQQPTE